MNLLQTTHELLARSDAALNLHGTLLNITTNGESYRLLYNQGIGSYEILVTTIKKRTIAGSREVKGLSVWSSGNNAIHEFMSAQGAVVWIMHKVAKNIVIDEYIGMLEEDEEAEGPF